MNRTLPPGKCGHRRPHPCRPPGPTGALLSARRLVGGTQAAARPDEEKAAEAGPRRPEKFGLAGLSFRSSRTAPHSRLWST